MAFTDGDGNNDKTSEEHSKVHGLSRIVWDPKTGQVARVAVIIYWKQAAADFMKRSQLHFPAARHILQFVRHDVGERERLIGPHLLAKEGQRFVRLGSTHCSKTVTYSVSAEAIRIACQRCPCLLDPWRISVLIFCSSATNSPAVFGRELLHTLENQELVFGSKIEDVSWQGLCHPLYRWIRSASSDGKSSRGHESSPRHRPFHTTAGRETAENSVASLHRAISNLLSVSATDPIDCHNNPGHYFERAVARLSQPSGAVGGGVHGAGSFGSQSLLGVAGILLSSTILCVAAPPSASRH